MHIAFTNTTECSVARWPESNENGEGDIALNIWPTNVSDKLELVLTNVFSSTATSNVVQLSEAQAGGTDLLFTNTYTNVGAGCYAMRARWHGVTSLTAMPLTVFGIQRPYYSVDDNDAVARTVFYAEVNGEYVATGMTATVSLSPSRESVDDYLHVVSLVTMKAGSIDANSVTISLDGSTATGHWGGSSVPAIEYADIESRWSVADNSGVATSIARTANPSGGGSYHVPEYSIYAHNIDGARGNNAAYAHVCTNCNTSLTVDISESESDDSWGTYYNIAPQDVIWRIEGATPNIVTNEDNAPLTLSWTNLTATTVTFSPLINMNGSWVAVPSRTFEFGDWSVDVTPPRQWACIHETNVIFSATHYAAAVEANWINPAACSTNGVSELHADASALRAGTYEVMATHFERPAYGCSCMATAQLIIASANLSLDDLDEVNEATVGGFAVVNDDDDNRNGTNDCDEPVSVPVLDENDLLPMSLNVADIVTNGSVTLSLLGSGASY